jgi:predicted dehydrogenase
VTVKIGLLGSGFVANFYMEGLRDVPGQRVIANFSRSSTVAEAFANRWGIPHHYDDMAALCERGDVDLVLVALPNHRHLDAVRVASETGKDMVVTKPLGRNAQEAAEMVVIAKQAHLMAGYAETEVFAPSVMRARAIIEEGAIGKVLTIRAREAHSGPHAAHFWDAEQAGGGSLLDMGCHTVEAARYFFGKSLKPSTAFAWGATLMHADKTTGEDNAVLLVRFDDGRLAVNEASWTMQGGMELRNEVYGTSGRIITDSRGSNITAFTTSSAGYVQEKAGSETGWLVPIPDEARAYGYHEEMRHFVECKANGITPRETFVDGYIVNAVLDAGYKSMRSGMWEPIDLDPDISSPGTEDRQ